MTSFGRPTGAIHLFQQAVLVVLATALLSPPCFWLGRAAVHQDLIPALGPFGFPVYFRRVFLIVALGATFGHAQRLVGLFSKATFWGPRPASHFARGLTLAGLALLPGLALLTRWGGLEWFAWRLDLSQSLLRLCLAGITALVVALLEEAVFRGVLLTTLRRSLRNFWAIAISAVIFALLHFIAQPHHGPVEEDVRWYAGFLLLLDAGQPLLHLSATYLALTTLVILGLTLGLATVVSGGLAYAMGLHAGIVGIARVLTYGARVTPEWENWLASDLRGGKLPPLVMAALFVLVAGQELRHFCSDERRDSV